MCKWVEKILKDNPAEKSLKAPEKKNNIAKIMIIIIIILKNLTERKKLNMLFLGGQCLQDVHLIKKKISLIIAAEKIV